MGRIGVAPSDNIESIIGNSQDVFPLIQLGDSFPIEFSPSEPEDTGLGLGFIPFLRYSGEGDNRLSEFPEFHAIKIAISENFNNTHLIKMRKKYSIWSNT